MGKVRLFLVDSCLLNKPDADIPRLKQILKNLFPGHLSVAQEEAKNRTMFKLNGNLHPFNGLQTPISIMSHSGAGTGDISDISIPFSTIVCTSTHRKK